MRCLRPVLLLCILAYAPARAEPDAALHGLLGMASNQESDIEALLALAGRLSGAELPSVPASATTTAGAVEARAGKIQAALTQLAILSGGNGHLALQLAQASRTDVIDVISGTATLADLEAVEGLVRHREKAWRLSRPIVVWPGAALVLSPGEVLEMDTAAGAFVLSFGTVQLTGATLRGDGSQNERIAAFRPFLLVTGQGAFRAERSTFAYLGFLGPVAFRGVSVLTGGLMRPDEPTVVSGNRFEQVFSVSFEGADGMMFTENRLEGAGAAAVSVKGGRGLVLAGNRIIATADGAGMRLSGVLQQVAILGNLMTKGNRNGLQIDGSTRGLVLRGNVLTGNAEAGVSIRNASCVAVQGNIVLGNGSAGLRLERSGLARIADNAILGNGGAGIEVQAQAGLGTVLVSDNLIARNREGLRAAGLGEVRLAGNDLTDQLPRQFGGDFGPWLAPYLTAGTELVIPAAANSGAVPTDPCTTE
jgi:poly(beta-D-mannuronate) C5 epimerase